MNYAYPDLARRGLGNMLFTWAQAVAYCHRTGARMIAPRWASLMRIGPWLRGERYKRYYGRNFTNKGYVWGWRRWLGNVMVFRGMDGFFDPFLTEQGIVRDELWRIVNPRLVEDIRRMENEGPFIGVHIRRGDFKAAGLCTADEWYLQAIRAALEMYGRKNALIRVFSDGYPEEVAFIARAFPEVRVVIMPKAPAIQDVLSLSKAEIAVCSPRSTFSMWAVFLGQMPSVWSKDSEVPRLYCGDDCTVLV